MKKELAAVRAEGGHESHEPDMDERVHKMVPGLSPVCITIANGINNGLNFCKLIIYIVGTDWQFSSFIFTVERERVRVS